MCFTKQIGTPQSNQPDPSAEIHPCGESPQKSALSEEMDGEIPSGEDSDSGSDPESDSRSCSDSDSQSEPGPGSVIPSEETSSENLKDRTTPKKTSPQEPDSNVRLKVNQIV